MHFNRASLAVQCEEGEKTANECVEIVDDVVNRRLVVCSLNWCFCGVDCAQDLQVPYYVVLLFPLYRLLLLSFRFLALYRNLFVYAARHRNDFTIYDRSHVHRDLPPPTRDISNINDEDHGEGGGGGVVAHLGVTGERWASAWRAPDNGGDARV